MCEPSHSVVQYPLQDPVSGDPTIGIIEAAIKPDRGSLIIPQGAKIGGFINYSAMGLGHSEALGKITVGGRQRLPKDIKYEAHWWSREFKLDGPCHRILKDDSYESGLIYANRVSLGDLKILRRFLEESLKKTETPFMYSEAVLKLFSSRGVDYIYNTIMRVFKFKTYSLRWTLEKLLSGDKKNITIGILMKATRKREYLNDLWADDVTFTRKETVMSE